MRYIKAVILLTITLWLQGCYSNVGVGTTAPLGKHSVVGSSVTVGSDGQLHGNIGIGTDIRL